MVLKLAIYENKKSQNKSPETLDPPPGPSSSPSRSSLSRGRTVTVRSAIGGGAPRSGWGRLPRLIRVGDGHLRPCVFPPPSPVTRALHHHRERAEGRRGVGEKTRKAPLPPPEGRRGERRPGKEWERSFGGREREREMGRRVRGERERRGE